MDSPNRIDPVGIAFTTPRQTPKDEFGDVLMNTMSNVVENGAVLASVVPGFGGLSAAVSSVKSFVSAAPQRTASAVNGVAGNGVVNVMGANGSGPQGIVPYSSLSPQTGQSLGSGEFSSNSPAVTEMARVSEYYMTLQNEVQQESRAYNTLSNVIKVRHDSAKAAINNIR